MGQSMKKVERWKMEMPTEEEMLPKDKYTVFDRKVKRYRKGIHSKLDYFLYGEGMGLGQNQDWQRAGCDAMRRSERMRKIPRANEMQRCRSGQGSARDSILLVSRRGSRREGVYYMCFMLSIGFGASVGWVYPNQTLSPLHVCLRDHFGLNSDLSEVRYVLASDYA